MRARFTLALVVSAIVVLGNLSASGCRPDPAAAPSPPDEGRRPLAEASSTTLNGERKVDGPSLTPTVPGGNFPHNEVTSLFVQLARELAPLPVYGLVDLSPRFSIASEWWPAIETDSPTAYNGPRIPNPQVSHGATGSGEAQVLLKVNQGWLMIIENFRGDLGDVQGVSVGEVEGRPATMYELSGGVLVQWSDGGAWYGVFGRGVEADVVLTTARALRIVPPTD